mmetsp:Transcript_10741/g.30201  ORF Transcript_10741/g.30201 Transcript_10741/m.30201 type:complete len:84 (-) Transcript_10741:135-386(-)
MLCTVEKVPASENCSRSPLWLWSASACEIVLRYMLIWLGGSQYICFVLENTCFYVVNKSTGGKARGGDCEKARVCGGLNDGLN